MPEATIEQIKGRNVITCDWVKLDGEELYWFNEWLPDYGGRHNLERLYAVLHAWKLAQAYDKKYLAKVAQAMKDDPLYGGESCLSGL
jgi:hypothetical protein